VTSTIGRFVLILYESGLTAGPLILLFWNAKRMAAKLPRHAVKPPERIRPS
jgi:hypothetical protein